jgi:hypothetical protein
MSPAFGVVPTVVTVIGGLAGALAEAASQVTEN